MAIVTAGTLAVLGLGLVVLPGSDETNGSARQADPACPVTVPSGETPPGSRATVGWHGSGKARVTLPPDGRLVVTTESPPPPGTTPGSVHADGAMSVKFLWWFARSAGRRVSVTGRLEGSSETTVLARGRRRMPSFWPSRLRFAREGCWRVTGRAGRARLTFVIEVSAAGSAAGSEFGRTTRKGRMTQACCIDCGLRFAGLPPPEVTICPGCTGPVAELPASRAMGYRLAGQAGPTLGLETALTAALARPRRDPAQL